MCLVFPPAHRVCLVFQAASQAANPANSQGHPAANRDLERLTCPIPCLVFPAPQDKQPRASQAAAASRTVRVKTGPEQVVSQVWGDIDVFLRYHVPEHHNEDDLPPLHTLLMDILNSVSFRVFGYGHVLLDGEPLPKLPEESDPRAQSRLTKDISSRVLAEFRDDVFATRRRVQRMEQRVTKPTAEGVGTEEDRALPLTLHPA